jgi:23S rRNA pseudouridine2457 synthase
MFTYLTIYKPFQVLSQFSPQEGKQTLKDLFSFSRDVYPVGRLDYDSEGLLILTNDTTLNHRLLNPSFAHEREYLVQVDGAISHGAIEKLETGTDISIDGKTYRTRPCTARVFETEPTVFERNPPIRFRKNIPTSWISLVLTEGKNRQVRKMTAAVGYPTLRLIRYRIGALTIGKMRPGDFIEWEKKEFYRMLGL